GEASTEPEEIGRTLVLLVYWGGAVVVCALFPGLSSVSLVAERERKALELSLVTALRPGDIVLGTAAASLAQGGLVLVALAPLLVLALLFGGVPPWVVLLLVALLASGAVVAVALGVHASATSRTAVRAVLGAYLSTFLVVGGGLVGAGAGITSLLDAQARGWRGGDDFRAILEVSAWAAVGAGWFAVFALLLARNALLPPAGGNRATLLRLHAALLLGLLLLAGVLTIPAAIATTGTMPGPWPWRTWRASGTVLIGTLAFALLCAAIGGSTEDPPDRRTAAAAARWWGPLLPLRVLYPGAWRGAAFAAIATAATLGAAGSWLEGIAPPKPPEVFGSPADPCGRVALGGGAYVAAVLAAGLFLRSVIGTHERARAALLGLVFVTQVFSLIGLLASSRAASGLTLTVWNGAAFSLVTLGISAWNQTRPANVFLDPAEGSNVPALDFEISGQVVPFATAFAALHLAAAAAFLAGAGVVAWRRRADALRRAQGQAATEGPGTESSTGTGAGAGP
ncbi:MAG: hypothetical protein L0216_14925, partial [Planctomycetales bacterium]|nr:hypothetical protein [Planctomycetales bacterium]